jgi:uncharacterized protein YutE (UPF0331/DUF86 family)
LKLLDDYTAKLRELAETDREEYLTNYILRAAVERLLQLSIECCLDIGSHLIARSSFRSPKDYRDIFAVLTEEGVLSQELRPRLMDMAGFRNLLVHDYADLEDPVVFRILQSNLNDFEAFARAITAYLKESGR